MNTTSEMCNDYYNKRSLSLNNITSHKDVHFPKNIKNIFTEMYVDEIYVSICQHMSEFNSKYIIYCYEHYNILSKAKEHNLTFKITLTIHLFYFEIIIHLFLQSSYYIFM